MRIIARVLGTAIVVAAILGAYGYGALVGQYRPEWGQPFSTWVLPIAMLFVDAGCREDDVTSCGFSDVSEKQLVSCDDFMAADPRNAVLFTFGQSNAANFGRGMYTPDADVVNFNFHDGNCYAADDPLLGPDGNTGSVWGRVGDKLIDRGTFDKVLVVPFAIGGTALSEWIPNGGRLHPRVERAAQEIASAGIVPTHVLWHQGEADVLSETTEEQYTAMFSQLVSSLRDYGIDAPVFPAVATICNNLGSDAVRDAQRLLPELLPGVYPGANTDTLTHFQYRPDNCHFSEAGLEAHAELWAETLANHEASFILTAEESAEDVIEETSDNAGASM